MSDQPIMEWTRIPEAPRLGPSVWSPSIVKRRLIAAVDHAHRTAGSVGPRAGSASDILARLQGRDWLFEIDPRTGAIVYTGPGVAVFDEEGKFAGIVGGEDKPRRRPPRYTPREVWNLEDAIFWPGRYLAASDPMLPRTLNVFLRCKVFRSLRFGEACKQREWPRRTAYDRVDAALAGIAAGLNRDRVDVWSLLNEDGDQWA
jgi:hypothetical protein